LFNVSAKIMRVGHDSINTKERKTEESATKKDELAAFKIYQSSPGISANATEGSRRGSIAASSPIGRIPSYFVPKTGPGAQLSIKLVVKKKEKQEASRLMGRCLFWSDLPLTITRNNPFWQPMCHAIAVVGLGLKPLHMRSCGGLFFKQRRRTSMPGWGSSRNHGKAPGAQ
jgi:hypothetical protein